MRSSLAVTGRKVGGFRRGYVGAVLAIGLSLGVCGATLGWPDQAGAVGPGAPWLRAAAVASPADTASGSSSPSDSLQAPQPSSSSSSSSTDPSLTSSASGDSLSPQPPSDCAPGSPYAADSSLPAPVPSSCARVYDEGVAGEVARLRFALVFGMGMILFLLAAILWAMPWGRR
jgi:hypothetical protein